MDGVDSERFNNSLTTLFRMTAESGENGNTANLHRNEISSQYNKLIDLPRELRVSKEQSEILEVTNSTLKNLPGQVHVLVPGQVRGR